jgi:hypothetical protein
MKKFIVIYHAPKNLVDQTMSTTPDEQEKGMEAWMEWAGKCGDKLVDMGAPLANGLQLTRDGSGVASRKDVVGYSVLQAETIDQARTLLKGHPHLGWDGACTIELHETMPLPGSN